MNSRFRAYIAAVTTVAIVTGVLGLALAPLWPPIGGLAGLIFWVAVVIFGSSASVRMPGGTVVDVGIAPLLACAVLGGPAAAVIAAAIGTFELRELRGFIPGTK